MALLEVWNSAQANFKFSSISFGTPRVLGISGYLFQNILPSSYKGMSSFTLFPSWIVQDQNKRSDLDSFGNDAVKLTSKFKLLQQENKVIFCVTSQWVLAGLTEVVGIVFASSGQYRQCQREKHQCHPKKWRQWWCFQTFPILYC
jgi:hypothetical protein